VKLQSFGGKESVKENRQGFLSRSIKQFFKLFESLKNVTSLSKRLFDKLKRACCKTEKPASSAGKLDKGSVKGAALSPLHVQ